MANDSANDARIVYAEIIGREHHVSSTHPPMDRLSRAAQFSPFAALTGYDDLIRESERETDRRLDLTEDKKEQLNALLVRLLRQEEPEEAVFTVFRPDSLKEGGEYVRVSGRIAGYDAVGRVITLTDGSRIPVEDISEIAMENGGSR